MPDLGGVVEFGLSEDGKNIETQIITEATMIFIPAGLYHGPLNFKKINDPKKPILFHDLLPGPDTQTTCCWLLPRSEACDLPVHFFAVAYSQHHHVFVHEGINNSIIADSILAEAGELALENGICIRFF